MEVLLTNDDGIYAPGLEALYKQLAVRHSVSVIAPDREQSAVGHGITLDEPLRTNRVFVNRAFQGYAVSGTPADCIKMGVLEILKSKPEMVISGINPGANVGVNVNYSGTVAAAKEAALYGILAIAASIHSREVQNYDEAAVFITELAQDVYANGLPFGEIAGIRISRLDMDFFPEYIEKRTDPRARNYYWQGCDRLPSGKSTDVDGSALCADYISITPLKCDQTDYRVLEDIKAWKIVTHSKDGTGPQNR
jgi:5'-nucleotidase